MINTRRRRPPTIGVQFIIPRISVNERTVAVVRARVELGGEPETEFVRRLRQAVTAWVHKSAQGKTALAHNNDDFNVGDLALWRGDPQLVNQLAHEGIYTLTVRTYSSSSSLWGWQFDDRLINDPDDHLDCLTCRAGDTIPHPNGSHQQTERGFAGSPIPDD